ncbi:MAG: hypothetical protein ACR2KG_07385, partial [Nocardioidaceae bacterium]
MTRTAAVARGQVWVAANVPYNQGVCHADINGTYREDCSGFVSMAWHLSQSYTTYQFDPGSSGFLGITQPIAWSDLLPGDALVINSSSQAHIVLFTGWIDSTHYGIAEESRTGVGTIAYPDPAHGRAAVSIYDPYWSQYQPIRYNDIVADSSPTGASGWAAFDAGQFHLVEPDAAGHMQHTYYTSGWGTGPLGGTL